MEFVWKSEPSHTSKIKFFDNKRVERDTMSKDASQHPPSRAVYRKAHPPSGVVFRKADPPNGE
eukprot:6247445-Karenia_brevis.AAC.1